jgi:hypothetical protein
MLEVWSIRWEIGRKAGKGKMDEWNIGRMEGREGRSKTCRWLV